MEPIPAGMERRSSKSDTHSPRKQEQQRRVGESPGKITMSPFRTMRNRLFTDETVRVKNTKSQQSQAQSLFRLGSSRSRSLGAIVTTTSFTKYSIPDEKATPYTMTDENPFVSQSEDEEEAEERQQQDSYCYANCNNDDVSSVSNDSARRINPNYALDQDLPHTPPAEIVVRKTVVSHNNNNNNKYNYNIERSGREDERASAVTAVAVAPPWAPRHGDNQDGTIHKNVLPLWQQHWVQGDIAEHPPVQQQLSPMSTVPNGAPSSRPPPVNTATPSPMVARPVAPRNEPAASTTAFTRVVSPRLPVIPPLSPLQLSSNNACCVSVKQGLCKTAFLSPDLLRVNTEDTTAPTATTTPTTEDTSYGTQTHIQKPKVLTQRRATTGALAVAPSTSLPLIVQSTSRRQHEPKDDIGSIQPHDKTSDNKSAKDRLLLGNRPRRKDMRGSQSVFSFGSIVGQSSILTPTSNTTGTDPFIRQQHHAPPSRVFGQMVKANQKLQKEVGSETFSPKRKNDLELLWQRCVAQPVRRLTGGEDDAARLQRSRTGCLT